MNMLKENERSANLAAAKVMRLTAVVVTFVLILNIVGIFIIDMTQMIVTCAVGMVLLFVPTIAIRLIEKPDKSYIKYLTVICAIIFTGLFTAVLPKHTVILYVYPIAISSLYFSGKLNSFSAILTIITVSASQLISFYIPCDKDANFTDLKHVVLFGIVPRALVLFAISLIFTMLCKRTASMLGNLMSAEQQEQLREKSAEISKTLVKAAREMNAISEQSAESGKEMSAQSESVMRGSVENTENIRSIGENMAAISENLRELDAMSREIEQLLKHSDDITAENNMTLAIAENGMRQIYDHTDNSMKIISELSHQSKRISQIVKMIEDISKQTDILSINATIEAVHAGQAGKGFSIVADEMGTLSAQTKSSAQEIGKIINMFLKNIDAAVSSMQNSFALTKDGMENMRLIKASAEKLSTSNSEISRNVGSITEAISMVANGGNEVTSKLTSVSRNIENNCAAVTSVSEMIRKTDENIEMMNTMVSDIRKMSEQLDTLAK